MRKGGLGIIGLVLLAASCGKLEPSDLDRGTLGRLGGTDNNETTVQSSGSLSCTASPSQTVVSSGQQFTVTVKVTGAQGGISIDGTGYQNVTNQTTFNLNAAYNVSSGPVTVLIQVTVRDTANFATCRYRITLQ